MDTTSMKITPIAKAENNVVAKQRAPTLPARTAADSPVPCLQARPFTREQRDKVTMLFGGLHWRVERVIQGAMENLGYKSADPADRDARGSDYRREVADIGQCCPTSFTTGNLANYLQRGG